MVPRTLSLLLIERGQNQEIANTGTTELVTLNFHVPPAYTKARESYPLGGRSDDGYDGFLLPPR